jgi:hypothetical protein
VALDITLLKTADKHTINHLFFITHANRQRIRKRTQKRIGGITTFGSKNATKGLNRFFNWYDGRDREEERIINSEKFKILEDKARMAAGTYEGKYVTRKAFEKWERETDYGEED